MTELKIKRQITSHFDLLIQRFNSIRRQILK